MVYLFSYPNLAWIFGSIIFFILLGKTVFGWVFISASKSGLVEKKWSLRGDLPIGRIIATNGEAGVQADLLAPGLHFWKWWWMYSIEQIDAILIPTGKIGVVKAENGQSLDSGAILAKTVVDSSNFQDASKFLEGNGVMGVQRAFLRNGIYRINTAIFNIQIHDSIYINEGKIGIVTVYDGKPIKKGEIAARVRVEHEKFQDADMFLNNGGERGLQEEILSPGEYYINPSFAKVEIQSQIKVAIGHVGVVTNYIGDEPIDTSGKEFRHGIIVSNGQKGVQQDPLNPGMYPTNLKTSIVEVVPTTNIVLNWANAKTESHELDSHLSTITARTRDGFSLNLDVSQIINIAHDEAPKVIARFGTLKNLISQVLEPTIGNYFRNSVQESNALDFITSRKQKQELAKEYINIVLNEYNVVGVDTLIGDIIPPDQLLEPIRKKHIAEQQRLMYEQQKAAEITRKDLENATAEADMQKEVVKSEREVAIAEKHAESVVKKQEGDSRAIQLKAIAEAGATKLRAEAEAEAKTKIGNAEAAVVQAKGLAEAQAYQKQVEALGSENLTRMNVVKEIANGKVKITPEIFISGGNGSSSSVEGLIAMQLMNQLSGTKNTV